jgi:hypothetical protein
MVNRSTTRVIPHFPVALDEVAVLFGTLVAETILASVHVRARKQAGHMDASDLIKALQTPCEEGVVHIRGSSTYGKSGMAEESSSRPPI